MFNEVLFKEVSHVAKVFTEEQFKAIGKPQVIFSECNMVSVIPKVPDDSWIEILEISIQVTDPFCDYEDEVEEIVKQLMAKIASTVDERTLEDDFTLIHKSDWVYIWVDLGGIPTHTMVLQRTDLNIKLIISDQA